MEFASNQIPDFDDIIWSSTELLNEAFRNDGNVVDFPFCIPASNAAAISFLDNNPDAKFSSRYIGELKKVEITLE